MRKVSTKLATISLTVAILLAPWSASAFRPVPLTRDARLAALSHVKMMNYFPSRHVWEAMWTHWDHGQINHDFGRIRDLGFNTVRLIIPAWTFGYPNPSALFLHRLRDAMQMAQTHGLQVQLTLFDQWYKYGDVAGSKTWVRGILKHYRGNRTIQSIEIRNEIDGTDDVATSWARQMIMYIHTYARTQLVTISPQITLDNLQALRLALDSNGGQPDYYSYHYYDAASDAQAKLQNAMDIVAPRRLFVGETGTPSGYGTSTAPVDSRAETNQLGFFKAVEAATDSLGLAPAAAWIFQDFQPGTFGDVAEPRYHLGVMRLDGTLKPSGTWLRAYLATR